MNKQLKLLLKEAEKEIWDKILPSWVSYDTKIKVIQNLLNRAYHQGVKEGKIKGYDKFFLEIDKRFKSFKIDKEMGRILQDLKFLEEGK